MSEEWLIWDRYNFEGTFHPVTEAEAAELVLGGDYKVMNECSRPGCACHRKKTITHV